MVSSLEYRGKVRGGRVERFQNPLQMDSANICALLLFPLPDEKCPLSCSFLICPFPVILLVTIITTAIYGAYSTPGWKNRDSAAFMYLCRFRELESGKARISAQLTWLQIYTHNDTVQPFQIRSVSLQHNIVSLDYNLRVRYMKTSTINNSLEDTLMP